MIVMLKKLLAPSLVFVALLAPLAGTANAYQRSPRSINSRERRQERRIHRGVRSGELTRREAVGLQRQQARIRVNEAYARRSGGRFTARERARVRREENRASRRIHRQKHDRQDRH
jgi:hypothetical protein